jgi:3-oxoacyl-[acyl-carrier-protein] synthase II
MNGRRVVITGAGALSALGATPDELWQGLLEDRSGVRRLAPFVDMGLDVTTGGDVDAVPRNGQDDGEERDLTLAGRAVEAALAEAGLDAGGCGLIWGAGLDSFRPVDGHVGLRSAGDCFAALSAPFRGPRRMLAVACATGTQALGEAFELVRRGRADACVAGGSSVMLTPFYLVGFARLGAVAVDLDGDDPAASCRPFDQRRRGFALADGAGAVVVEPADAARRRGAVPLAEIVGFGTSQDAFDLNRPPADGAGAELAMRRAVADAGIDPADVDAVNAHGTATLAGDRAEATALRRFLGDTWKKTPVSSTKGAIGHAMAAAGALEAIVACRTCATGIVPPTVNLRRPDPDLPLDHVLGEPRDAGARTVLSVSLGMGGQNAAIVLRRADP